MENIKINRLKYKIQLLIQILINLKKLLLNKKERYIKRLQNTISKKNEYNSRLQNTINKKNEYIKRLQNTINKKNEYIKKLQRRNVSPVISSVINFSENCEGLGDSIVSDVYLVHDDFPLLAANILADKYGGKIFYDAIEIPEHKKRSGVTFQKWSSSSSQLLNNLRSGITKNVSGIITVSDSLASYLKGYHQNVLCLENFRYYEKLKLSNQLREDCCLTKDDKLVLHINHLTPYDKFEIILDALKLLPENCHFVILGNVSPTIYKKKVMEIVESYKLVERVHFIDPVPYNILSSYASSADIGIIPLNINVKNNYVSLPNRLFDYVSARLPICSAPIPSIKNIIDKYEIGVVFEEYTAESISNAIKKMILNKNKRDIQLEKAAKELDWRKNENKFIEFLNFPKTVTILGTKDLTKNNRTKRMASTLAEKGIEVKIVTTQRHMADAHPNISWVYCEK